MYKIMNVCIIGSGWYGLHTASLLQYKHNVTIIEKHEEIFTQSSYYNQNRLHLGYHYPRCSKTQHMCKHNFNLFIEKYKDVVEDISLNLYFISKESRIDYDTYDYIYKNYNHTKITNNILNNVYPICYDVNEKVINNSKVKKMFIEQLNNVTFILNYTVFSVKNTNNGVIINNDKQFDIVIDCTNNHLNLSTQHIYNFEKTISLLYRKKKNTSFNAITIMDGHFFSLYPINDKCIIYSLTHVKYTPIIVSNNIMDLYNTPINLSDIEIIKANIENDVIKYFPDFLEFFEYENYFFSTKTKLLSSSITDSRECNIEKNENIISVNCCKISGIFEFEKYLYKINII